ARSTLYHGNIRTRAILAGDADAAVAAIEAHTRVTGATAAAITGAGRTRVGVVTQLDVIAQRKLEFMVGRIGRRDDVAVRVVDLDGLAQVLGHVSVARVGQTKTFAGQVT